MLGKWYLHPYLVVPLISARVPLISTSVSAHCQAILLVSDEFFNTIIQSVYEIDSPNLQDSHNMALYQMIFHMGHVYQTFMLIKDIIRAR